MRDIVDDGRTAPPPPPESGLAYRRIVLKLSGEALAGAAGGFGIEAVMLRSTAAELAEVHALGVQIGIVVGARDLVRVLLFVFVRIRISTHGEGLARCRS